MDDSEMRTPDAASFDRVLAQIVAIERKVTDMRAESQALAECFVELCESLRLRRALVSTVHEGCWMPEQLFLASDLDEDHTPLREFLDDAEISLRSAALERSMVRSRSPQLVEAPLASSRTFKPLMKISDSHGYAAAPIVARGRVVGLIHIDRHEAPVRTSDLENALMVGEVLALMVDEVTHQRRLATLSARAMEIAKSAPSTSAPATSGPATSGPAGAAQLPRRSVLTDRGDAVLTEREQRVLSLLAQGKTNREIAQLIGASASAVKGCVSQLLHKLGARTRVEAAAMAAEDGR